jgi:PTH1 family peptidyl-tRNA hydrolase
MSDSGKYLIVGLGNPGREYRVSRHNAGFLVVDRLAHEMGQAFTRRQADALYVTGRLEDRPVVLAKPQRYMNLSGGPVASLVRFHEIPPERLLIVFDELDLPLGTLRLRPEGGTSGHRGMASIVEALGTQAFPRLRFGIGRPPGQRQAVNYVLQTFSRDEEELAEATLERAAEAVKTFLREGIVAAMNRYNARDADEDNLDK